MNYSIPYILSQMFSDRKWSIIGENLTDLNILDGLPAPTMNEIIAADNALFAKNEATQYRSARAAAYPAMADQLDMLWHSMDSGEIPKSMTFYVAIQSVKDKFPKS